MAKKIIGHATQQESLLRLWSQGKLAHALLLSGISGIGKKIVADNLAAIILCENTLTSKSGLKDRCGKCQSCKLLDSNSHPDYHLVDCDQIELSSVEVIRSLLYKLNLSPYLSNNRVIIFNNAENLSIQAANILLKSFEEPRPETYFFVISSNLSRLPSTLVSRCQVWNFDALTFNEIEKVIAQSQELTALMKDSAISKLSKEEQNALVYGSIESLVDLIELDQDWESLNRDLELALYGNVSVCLDLAEKLTKNKDKVRTSLRALQNLTRSKMLLEHNTAIRVRWAELLHNLLASEKLILERNASTAYVMREVFLRLGTHAATFTSSAVDDTLHGLVNS